MTILVQQLRAEIESLNEEIQRLKGLQPEGPPRPPEGEGLPRYGLRWNGPQQPLSVPMDDGYWTPWHLAEQYRMAPQTEVEPQAKPADDLAKACMVSLIESGAENYTEHHFEVRVVGEDVARPVVVTTQFSDRPSPHELRLKAEAERDTAQAQVAEALKLLRKVDNDLWPEWDDTGAKTALMDEVQAFLAQAEQQEAQSGRDDDYDPEELLKPGVLAKEVDRGIIKSEQQEAQGAQARDELERLSVTNILLDVVPGPDGMGYEVYAKSVEQVERRLCDLGDKVEDLTNELSMARAALATQPALPASVEAMSFEYAHFSGERRTVSITREDVIEGMEDALYEKLSDQICRCEPIGETNVVECNCQDYVEEFALVAAKPAVRGADHGQ